MIGSFRSKTAAHIFHGEQTRYARKVPKELHSKLCRLFDQLNAATQVESLQIPPSNRLEKLSGDLKGFWSLRVNNQWRVIFVWKNGYAEHIDVVDYH